jgi:TolB-like protein
VRSFLLVLGIAGCASLAASPRAAAEPTTLALLPIAVHSSEPDVAYLSAGLSEMLASRLERSGRVRVVRVDGEPVGSDSGRAIEAARGVAADFALFGSFTQFGQGASLDVRCAPVPVDGAAPAETRKVFIQSGSVGEIIPRLDELAEKVTRYLEGRDTSSPASSSPAEGPDDLQEIQRRIEALERAVFLGDRTAAASGGGIGAAGDAPPAEGGDPSVR